MSKCRRLFIPGGCPAGPSPPKIGPPDRFFGLRPTVSEVYRDEATDNVKTDYASAGGAALRLKKTGTGPLVPEYTHFDLQGSAVAATDAAGAVTWRESYRPYGRPRLDPPANDNNTGYTGHLVDKSTGLVYMQARYYDPLIGRFYSTDPVGYQDQLNLYAYVHNDPVNNTDPTGECANLCTSAIGAASGLVIGGAVELAVQFTDGKEGINFSRVGISAFKGFVSGGVIGATGCVACGAAAASAIGAVDGGVTAAQNGENVVAGAIAQATVDGVSTLAGGAAGKAIAKPFVASAAAQITSAAASAVATQSVTDSFVSAINDGERIMDQVQENRDELRQDLEKLND